MPRVHAAIAILFVGPAITCAAPTLKEPKQPLYYPTTEGAKRVYEMRVGDNAIEITEVVTKVEKKLWASGWETILGADPQYPGNKYASFFNGTMERVRISRVAPQHEDAE